MEYFFQYADWHVIVLYFVCMITYLVYFSDKFKRTKIIFSPFNFQIVFFLFVLLIVSPFQYDYNYANTWYYFPDQTYIEKLNESYMINLLGFILMGITMMLIERRAQRDILFSNFYNFIYMNVKNKYIHVISMAITIFFILYIILYSDGIPIFMGKRFIAESNQFIYLLLNSMVYILGWYSIGCLVDKKARAIDYLVFFLVLFGLIITGNRTPILRILYAALLLTATSQHANPYLFFKQIKVIVTILFSGILLIMIRSGSDIEINSLIYIFNNYLIYGSTFCDIRDGARVLWGYHNMYSDLLYGRTYLASLLSFIPSSFTDVSLLSDIAEFRNIYSGGKWSTLTLFGIENHYGLRGGMFSPAYINFGYFGIIIIAIILGYWFANCEILYKKVSTRLFSYDTKRVLFSYCFISIFFELLYAPAGFNAFWGYLLVFSIIIIISGFKIKIRKSI